MRKILIEPKNSLCKQYQKLFELDDVILDFDDGAIDAITEKAIARNTGARGLRAILEEIMLDVMYEIPSSTDIERCIITKETIIEGKSPEVIYNKNRKPLKRPAQRKSRVKKNSVS